MANKIENQAAQEHHQDYHAEMQAINEQLIIAVIRQQEIAEMAARSAENARKSSELYCLLARNFPNGMVLLFDQELRHVLAGGSGLAVLGFSKEWLEGRTLWGSFAAQTWPQIEPAYRAARAGEGCVFDVQFPVAAPTPQAAECIHQVRTLPVSDEQENILTGMAVAQDVTKQRQAEAAIHWQAYHDPLTGLPNRALLQDRLDQVLAISERSGERAALLFLDLNRFKQVNDTLGHSAGDHLLEAVALRLTCCLRAEDTVARVGGDEFVVLLPSLQADGDAAEIAEKIMDKLAEPLWVDDHRMSVTVSVGISVFPADGRDAASLMHKADSAMYRIKADPHSRAKQASSQMNARRKAL